MDCRDHAGYAAARAALLSSLAGEIKDRRVLAAIGKVPRECFLPPGLRRFAYANRPLPIGHEQTISQPLIVAMMSAAMELKGGEKVLEVGTGSGYQAAVLAELAAEVFSVERIPALAEAAARRLAEMNYTNITVNLAGQSPGWEPAAPYDAIMVTAAAPRVPEELVAQLADGGRLVIPVGGRDSQELFQIIRLEGGNIVRNLGGCRFVSLIGSGGWDN